MKVKNIKIRIMIKNLKIIVLLASLSIVMHSMDNRARLRLAYAENNQQERPNAKSFGLASGLICCANILKNWYLPPIAEPISMRTALVNASKSVALCAICLGCGICCIECCSTNQCRKATHDCQKFLSFCCGEEIEE